MRFTVRSTAVFAAALGILTLASCDATEVTEPSIDAVPELSLAKNHSGKPIAPVEVVEIDGRYYIAGTILVRFRNEAQRENLAQEHGASFNRRMNLSRTWVMNIPKGREKNIERQMKNNPNVEFAELDELMAIVPCESGTCDTPNDGFFGYKWDLHNDGSINNSSGTQLALTGAAGADMNWLEAYQFLGAGFAGSATIGIIDTGIQHNHQDLNGRVILEKNFATGYPDTLVSDRDGHGSHVAGIAAARGNNGVGVSGVAYGVNIKLINAKGCDLYLFPGNVIQTSCPNSSTANAIVWAVDNGANVLNMSFGGSPTAVSGAAVHLAALQYARSHNVLPVCSTGNDNAAGIGFPARFAECVAVGATDWNDTRASYSNYGAEIDVTAPGGDGESLPNGYSLILSVDGDASEVVTNSYAWLAGTSMAAPQVTGLAGLLYAMGMTNVDSVEARIKNTSDDLGTAGFDNEYGHGRINIYRAVTNNTPNRKPVPSVGGPYSGNEGVSLSFDGTGTVDPDGNTLTYKWSFGDGSLDVTNSTGTASHAYADNGTYNVKLVVTDQWGMADSATTTATVSNVAPTGTFTAPATVNFGSTFTISITGGTDVSADAGTLTYAFNCGAGAGLSAFGAANSATCTASAASHSVVGVIKDKDGGETTYNATVVSQALPTTTTVDSAAAQYSDFITLRARVSPSGSAVSGSVEFFIGSTSVGTAPLDSLGNAVVTGIANSRSAGSYATSAIFTSSTPAYAGSTSAAGKLTVLKEAASVSFAGNPVAIQVAAPGGSAPSFSFQVILRETTPDLPADSSAAGNINLAGLSVQLVPVGPGANVSASCSGASAASGYASRTFTCSVSAGAAVNVYTIEAAITGDYYAGSSSDVVTVFDPSLGFATGGGSFYWPGTTDKTNFGFTMQYGKNGTNVKGNLIVVRHLADGTVYRVKSNALTGLALSAATSEFGYATFTGKSTYIEPSWATGKGNISFTMYVEDRDNPGTESDRVWLQVAGGMSMASPAATNAVSLTGGNIAVPHGAGGGKGKNK